MNDLCGEYAQRDCIVYEPVAFHERPVLAETIELLRSEGRM